VPLNHWVIHLTTHSLKSLVQFQVAITHRISYFSFVSIQTRKILMVTGRRWTVRDRYGNDIYLTQERWEHIIDPINHPEMVEYEEQLKETIRTGTRKQDPLNARKYRYIKAFDHLAEDNTHIIAIVLFGFSEDTTGRPVQNNYITTAYQKEIG
jgi:hypothetical protein